MNNFRSDEFRKDIFSKLGLEEEILYLTQIGKIQPFSKRLLHKIRNTNLFMYRDFMLLFEEGMNIGSCGMCSRYLSFSFEDFNLVEFGICQILIGTKGAPQGQHAWLEVGDYIYDTTLLLKIQKDVAYNEFGYVPQKMISKEELCKDTTYVMQRRHSKDLKDLKEKLAYRDELKALGLKCSYFGLY